MLFYCTEDVAIQLNTKINQSNVYYLTRTPRGYPNEIGNMLIGELPVFETDEQLFHRYYNTTLMQLDKFSKLVEIANKVFHGSDVMIICEIIDDGGTYPYLRPIIPPEVCDYENEMFYKLFYMRYGLTPHPVNSEEDLDDLQRLYKSKLPLSQRGSIQIMNDLGALYGPNVPMRRF